MKTSLNKLRGLAGLKHGNRRDKRQRQPMAHWEEIAQAGQEMQDMKDCYERLLSAAAGTTNSVYEFSESLKEIGDCLLEKTALSNFDDEESGKALLMLGKVQLELQRRVDVYRSHISRTITVPSEFLLNELQTVEEMKSQCEEKRMAYEEALKTHREKGKVKSGKVDSFPFQNLQAASDDYDQEVNHLLFRMRSLKQGQYRSLLTQAARHHAAQLSFFKKSYLSLEAIEPYVKSVAKVHHIDHEFSGLEDDIGDDDNDDDEYSEGNDDDEEADDVSSVGSELSFDNKQDPPRHYTRKPMEDVDTCAFRKDLRPASISAPLFSDRRSDPNYKPIQMLSSSSQKHATYALPTPPEPKTPVSFKSKPGVSNPYFSSPLDKTKYEKLVTHNVVSGPLIRDSNHNTQPRPLPPPLLNNLSPPHVDQSFSSAPKKVKRYAFSGPLTGKQWQHKPAVTSSGPIGSGSFFHTPGIRPLSTLKLSSHISSTVLPSPKISELHELPRPPPNSAFKRPSPHFDYSEPLRPNKVADSAAGSTLPMPPPLNRSYSIPTRAQVTQPMDRQIPSPPPTPDPLSTRQPTTPTP